MYNNYMDTLFQRDMSSNQPMANVMQDDMYMQSVQMGQPMSSNYFNQSVSGDFMQQPMQRNSMVSSEQSLRVPHQRAGDIFLYTVKPGDNLYAIARVFGSTVDYIVAMNSIEDGNSIHPGQSLYVPVIHEQGVMPIQQRQNYGLYF